MAIGSGPNTPSVDNSFVSTLFKPTKTRQMEVQRQAKATSRSAATVDTNLSEEEPRSRWIGGAYRGPLPIYTGVRQFHPDTIKKGAHVLYLFGGITCGGLRVILSTS